MDADLCWACSVSASWIFAAWSQMSSGVSMWSSDAASCSFIRDRSWMFRAEKSISSSVTPQMPTSARAISGSSSSRTAGRWILARALLSAR